jgi:general secretion pathway protein D
MSTRKNWSAIIVILAALFICGLSTAVRAFQEPGQAPTSESERRQALERLTKQLQEGQQNARPIPGSGPQTQTAPASPPLPTYSSNIQGGGGKVLLNFNNAELSEVINQISGTLGLTPLVIDPEVKGSVIMNSGTISTDDIMPLFNLILKNNNAALIKQDGVYQIVPISSALKKGVDIIESPTDTKETNPKTESMNPRSKEPAGIPGGKPSSGVAGATQLPLKIKTPSKPQPLSGSDGLKNSRLATHIIHVDFVPVKDLIEPVRIFMTEGGVIMPYERLNMLILTDYTDSAERIIQIIHMLDNNYLDPNLVELVKVKNNASADVADDLRKIFGSGTKDSPTGIQFTSLDRMNAIFITAGSKRGLEEVKDWINKLDASSGRTIQTYIYKVLNSTASNIAMMVSALYGGDDTSGGSSSTGAANQPGGIFGSARNSQGNQGGNSGSIFNQGSQSGMNSQSPYGNQSNNGGSNSGSNSGIGGFMAGSSYGGGRQLGPQLNVNRSVSSQILRGGSFTGLQGEVRMVVDELNNALVIQATAADYAYISETIRKMDVLPRQVVIDARIFEVDLNDNLSYGVSAALQGRTTGSNGEHLTTAGSDPKGVLKLAGDSSLGALSAKTFAFIGNSRQILVQLDALRTKTKVRVLESPSILALDGMQAHFVVGSEVPYPNASFYGSSGGATTSVGYRDTGISLIVQPRISASGSVTMDIMQEVSAPGASIDVGDGGKAPSFSKTSVSTTLSVKDGETVAIAGLIRDSSDHSRAGIPFLSDIPLLGNLFGYTSKTSTRSELIILITPHVVQTPEELQEMTQDLKDSLRNVRQYSDEKDRELIKDKEKAREDRINQDMKTTKKTNTSISEFRKQKKSKKTDKSEQEVQPEQEPQPVDKKPEQ